MAKNYDKRMVPKDANRGKPSVAMRAKMTRFEIEPQSAFEKRVALEMDRIARLTLLADPGRPKKVTAHYNATMSAVVIRVVAWDSGMKEEADNG